MSQELNDPEIARTRELIVAKLRELSLDEIDQVIDREGERFDEWERQATEALLRRGVAVPIAAGPHD